MDFDRLDIQRFKICVNPCKLYLNFTVFLKVKATLFYYF